MTKSARKRRPAAQHLAVQDIGTPERRSKGVVDTSKDAAGRPSRVTVVTCAHRIWDRGSAELIAVERYLNNHSLAIGVFDADGAGCGGSSAPWQRTHVNDVMLAARDRLDIMHNAADRAVRLAREAGKKLPQAVLASRNVLSKTLIDGRTLGDAAVVLGCSRDGFSMLFRVMVEGMAE